LLAPATSEVACSGAKHRIEWRDGKLQLLDHDVEAEKTLAVLGSELPRCVGILEAWYGFEVDPFDPRMLVALLAEDVLSDRARTQVHTKYGIRATDTHSFKLAWSLGSHDKVRKMVDQARHFLALYTLPDDLRKRFALDFISRTIESWGKRGFKKRHFPAFELLVNLIAERSFRRTIKTISESLGIGVPVPVKWRVLDPGAPPHFSGLITRSTVRYETRLPISWLSNVWVRSMDVVDETFVLQAVEAENETLEALAVRWTAESADSFRASMSPARLKPSEDGWGLSWVSP
jgi:hypothetical protein